jgi:dCMP deaminase
MTWDEKFINLATHIASWSKDKSTKVGCVIVDEDNRIITTGFNGFPVGFNDDIPERHERPVKYSFTEHGERNSIYSAARLGVSVKGATIYVATLGNDLFVCADCARGIIQSGIKRIVIKEPDWNNERWAESVKISKEMLEECKIEIKFI